MFLELLRDRGRLDNIRSELLSWTFLARFSVLQSGQKKKISLQSGNRFESKITDGTKENEFFLFLVNV